MSKTTPNSYRHHALLLFWTKTAQKVINARVALVWETICKKAWSSSKNPRKNMEKQLNFAENLWNFSICLIVSIFFPHFLRKTLHPKAASRCVAFSRAAAALCRARLRRREPRRAREALQTAMEAMAEGRCHGPWGCQAVLKGSISCQTWRNNWEKWRGNQKGTYIYKIIWTYWVPKRRCPTDPRSVFLEWWMVLIVGWCQCDMFILQYELGSENGEFTWIYPQSVVLQWENYWL